MRCLVGILIIFQWGVCPHFRWLQIGHQKGRERFTFAPLFRHMYHSAFSYRDRLHQSVLSLPDWIGSHLKRGWALALIRLSTLLHYVLLLKSACLILLFFLSPLSLSFPCLSVLCCRWDCQHFGGRHLREGDAVHWPSQVCVKQCVKMKKQNKSCPSLRAQFTEMYRNKCVLCHTSLEPMRT